MFLFYKNFMKNMEENIATMEINKMKDNENVNSESEKNFFDFENLSNKKILNCIYGNEIIKIIDELSKYKENSNIFMKKTNEDLNLKYDHFKNEFFRYINSATNQIINAFHLDVSNINEEILKVVKGFVNEKMKFLNKVITLYKQINEVIHQNFLILENFLQNFELNQEHPLQDFFQKEFKNITNSWLFVKLDLEKFNFKSVIEESNLNTNYKDFLMKECHEKNPVMKIVFPELKKNYFKSNPFKKDKYKNEIKLLSDNASHLEKLKIKNSPNIIDLLGNMNYDKLEKLKLNNSIIQNNNIFNRFPSLKKLSIKHCPSLDTNIFNNNLNQLHLKQLILDKNGFVDEDIDNLLLNFILKSSDILNNLEILSLAYNNISNIDFTHYLSAPKDIFISLNTLNLRNNDIYKISLDINYFPKLKFLDCCNNNLKTNDFRELDNNDNIIILQSGNFFLMDDTLCEQYYTNLKNKLAKNNKFSLKNLSLSYIPEIYSSSFFNELNINDSLLINLKVLDLSYNGLTCDTFFSFISKNKECLYLKTLNLIGNQIDDTFFEKYLNLGLNKIFSNLNNLYLNDNKIGNDSDINYRDEEPISKKEFEKDIYKLRLIYKFINENKNLKKLTLNKNPISEKHRILYEYEELFINENEGLVKKINDKIIINCFYSFLVKIKNDLPDRNDFNIGFDCIYDINLNSQNYQYESQPIVFNS